MERVLRGVADPMPAAKGSLEAFFQGEDDFLGPSEKERRKNEKEKKKMKTEGERWDRGREERRMFDKFVFEISGLVPKVPGWSGGYEGCNELPKTPWVVP